MLPNRNGSTNGAVTEPLAEVDYPMPHAPMTYQPAPPFDQPLEELEYPEPGHTIEEEKA